VSARGAVTRVERASSPRAAEQRAPVPAVEELLAFDAGDEYVLSAYLALVGGERPVERTIERALRQSGRVEIVHGAAAPTASAR
jgi:hypothetical protein